MGLDIDRFFDFVSKDQRSLLIPFLISLPVVYTLMMLYVDGYADYDLFDRCIFAIAATVTGLAVSIATATLSKGMIATKTGANMFVVIVAGNLIAGVIRTMEGQIVDISGQLIYFLGILALLIIVCGLIDLIKRRYDKYNNRKHEESPGDQSIPK